MQSTSLSAWLCKAHWSFVKCEVWGISVRSAGFTAHWPDPYECREGPEYLQSVTVTKPDLQAFLLDAAWSIAAAILHVFVASLGVVVFLTLACAARDVRFIGGVTDGFTTIVLLLLFRFEWQRIGKWLTQGGFASVFASVAVNLILAFFALSTIASAAKQLQLSEGQVTILTTTWCTLILTWLLRIVWKIGRAIYSRASWRR